MLIKNEEHAASCSKQFKEQDTCFEVGRLKGIDSPISISSECVLFLHVPLFADFPSPRQIT